MVVESLGNRAIPGELSTILAGLLRAVHKDGAALPSDKRSVREIYSFLVHLTSGVDHIPNL